MGAFCLRIGSSFLHYTGRGFMGAGVKMRKLRDQVFAEQPSYIFCGGYIRASTVDHVPPRAVFNFRHRPKGLEFPACQECNSGARIDEQVAAMLCRIYPDGETVEEQGEMHALFEAVSTNRPGLLEEMMPSFRQEKQARQYRDQLPPHAGVLNCRGPILNTAIHRFGAKIGFALHYYLTKKIVPPTGGAAVWWFSNYQWLTEELPSELAELVGNPRTLRQGTWNVEKQFRYGSIATEDNSMSVHLASFRESFAVCAFVAEQASKVQPPKHVKHVTLHCPGWLKISPM